MTGVFKEIIHDINPRLGAVLNPPHDHSPLGVELIGVTIVTLLLTVLQTTTFVILQHPMLAAVMSITETAVPNNTLRGFLAILMSTSDLLGGPTTYG